MANLSAAKICVIAVTLALAWPAQGKQVNWPQSYHDAGLTGYNPREVTLRKDNVANLQLLWGQGVAGGVTGYVLDNGVIYAQGQGDSDPVLNAIDAATGTTLWSTVQAGQDGIFLNGTVASDRSLVFAGCGFKDAGGNNYGAICAYDKATGSQVWQTSHNCNCLPESQVIDAPVYADGTIYFAYNDRNACCGSGAFVIAADAKTGAPKWTFNGGDAGPFPNSDVAVSGGLVYFGCGQGAFAVCAVSQADGTLVWSLDIGSGFNGAISAANGVVYAALSNGADKAVAIDGANGSQIWTAPLDTGNCRPPQPAAIAGRMVYVMDTSCTVHALRARSGKEEWSAALNTSSVPSIANGVLYMDGGPDLGGTRPSLSAFDALDGALLWHSDSPAGTIYPTPIVANGIAYGTSGSCGSICAYALPAAPAHR